MLTVSSEGATDMSAFLHQIYELVWRTSSYSSVQGNCVEVARAAGLPRILVRDSRRPAGPVLSFAHPGWSALVRGLVRA
jgi:hypothetical protein